MPTSESPALSNFNELAQVLAENFAANAQALDEAPSRQVMVVLGSSASDITSPSFPAWTTELKERVLDEAGKFFHDDGIFLREICRVFSRDFGHFLWGHHKREEIRQAILEKARVEQISNVACQMLGHVDIMVRELISREYQHFGEAQEGPPPHLTYELMAHLTMHGFINHIITMNFDEMLDMALENELGPRGFTRVITGHEPVAGGDTRLPSLLKVHGTASSPESLRFTYTDVSVMTSAQAKHLKNLLESATRPDCDCLDLVSFGYSWLDADLAQWVIAHLGRFKRVFIIRREDRLPEFFQNLDEKDQSKFRVLSVDQLCGGEALSSSFFWWCLVDQVWERLKEKPLIPFSRHLLLGNLLAPDSGPGLRRSLTSRVRIEILLHLLKSKGMINTFGAPDSPRIRGYFSRLRNAHNSRVTVEGFLNDLDLGTFMRRSPEPQARDTFFSTATTRRKLVEDVAVAFVNEGPRTIKRPVIDNGILQLRPMGKLTFVRDQVEQIADAPEIEITKEVNVKLHSIFSHPRPISSFSQFAEALERALQEPWTHLLAIVESKRWLSYPWSKAFFEQGGERQILMILPSAEGLAGWKVGADLLRKERAIHLKDRVLELRIPWWRHNQHLFLPVRLNGPGSTLGPGLYYRRDYKSPAVAPVLLDEARDRAKLLSTFMLYAQRSKEEGNFKEELRRVVAALLQVWKHHRHQRPRTPDAAGEIDPDMVDLVRRVYEMT